MMYTKGVMSGQQHLQFKSDDANYTVFEKRILSQRFIQIKPMQSKSTKIKTKGGTQNKTKKPIHFIGKITFVINPVLIKTEKGVHAQ